VNAVTPPAHTRPVRILISGGADLGLVAEETGCPTGTLLVPTCNNRRVREGYPFAVDNGAFTGFNRDTRAAFGDILAKSRPHRERCLFVAVPDVVGSARRTLECFEAWRRKLNGWPLALVCQDGQEHLPIPWHQIEAVFIGGSTEWKLSKHAEHVVRAAQIHGKHVHVGRVNTPGRFSHFEALGVDSIDGGNLAWRREHRLAIRRRHDDAPALFEPEPLAA